MAKLIDMTGKVISRLTVESPAASSGGKSQWQCRCVCGQVVVVTGGNLRAGITKSCGCLQKEIVRLANTTHGGVGRVSGAVSSEYAAWQSMKRRCYNPNTPGYERWGGRGIEVCEQWRNDYQSFRQDMGPRPSPYHSLDRHPDKNGNYEPGNCRWATPKQQSRNKRNNRIITINGQSRCLREWAEEIGVTTDMLESRLSRGWNVERAFTEPVRKLKHHSIPGGNR